MVGIAHHKDDTTGNKIGQDGGSVGRFTAVNGAVPRGTATTKLVALGITVGALSGSAFKPDRSRYHSRGCLGLLPPVHRQSVTFV